jgi:predicted anti-sigma-YlaC factor YlaD
MHCEQAAKMMSARLDGCLDRTELAHLEDHLVTCSACRVEWRRMQALDGLFRSVPMRQAPLRLRPQVIARIERREQARRAIIGGLTLALGTATLALLLLAPLSVGLLNNLGIAPALLVGGVGTVTQLLFLADALGRLLFVLLDQFARPLAVLSLGSLLAALALNGLWIRTVRRLRVAH